MGALKNGLSNIVIYDRDLDYLDKLPNLLKEPTLDEIQLKVQQHIKPNKWIWLVVGDLSKIEEPIRALNLGDVEVLD